MSQYDGGEKKGVKNRRKNEKQKEECKTLCENKWQNHTNDATHFATVTAIVFFHLLVLKPRRHCSVSSRCGDGPSYLIRLIHTVLNVLWIGIPVTTILHFTNTLGSSLVVENFVTLIGHHHHYSLFH